MSPRKWWLDQNLAIRVISILVLGLAAWRAVEYIASLYNEYGANTENRAYVTNPENITAAFVHTLELCQKDQTQEGINCNQAIKGLQRLIAAYDLQAQRSMAKSALGLLHLNFWQLFFGFVTLIAIGWTLYETRQTALAATKTANSAENAERAHVYAKPTFDKEGRSLRNQQIDSPLDDVQIHIHIKNYGHTPARNITCSWGRASPNRQIQFHNTIVDALGANEIDHIAAIKLETIQEFMTYNPAMHLQIPIFVVHTTFTDVFGDESQTQICTVVLSFKGENGTAVLPVPITGDPDIDQNTRMDLAAQIKFISIRVEHSTA